MNRPCVPFPEEAMSGVPQPVPTSAIKTFLPAAGLPLMVMRPLIEAAPDPAFGAAVCERVIACMLKHRAMPK